MIFDKPLREKIRRQGNSSKRKLERVRKEEHVLVELLNMNETGKNNPEKEMFLLTDERKEAEVDSGRESVTDDIELENLTEKVTDANTGDECTVVTHTASKDNSGHQEVKEKRETKFICYLTCYL